MILIDAGPLIALNDPGDPWHQHCLQLEAAVLGAPFATTWPCIAEAMHMLGRSGGFRLQSALWRMVRNGLVLIANLTDAEILLTENSMEHYQDHPRDLADATLVALADFRAWRKVFTLDSDFFACRLRDVGSLEVIVPTKS
jgi:uncharacterized protein